MALSSCFSYPLSSLKNKSLTLQIGVHKSVNRTITTASVKKLSVTKEASQSSFVRGSSLLIRPRVGSTFIDSRKRTRVQASWLATSQIASNVFTMGTVAVLPFYTLMVFAPKAQLTKKCMESSLPYAVLGLLYVYLLYLSWTPDTIRYMFASKYMLPELTGIAKMFSNELTLASAWIHLLVIDLFAARQVFKDGLENKVETRHSVSLCLLFCPVGVITHFITKKLTKNTGHGL